MDPAPSAQPAKSSKATRPIQGTAVVPGDKSISHRALMLSSQALGTTDITGLLEGEDVLNTARALEQLGVPIRRMNEGHWQVKGVGAGGLHAPSAVLDMGNAGTGARLLMGLLAPYGFTSRFTGDASLCSRPMGRVIAPLSEMGVRFDSSDGKRLPLSMQGTDGPLPITYTLPVASAQVKSAILLAGLNIAGRTTVIEPTPTRDHTERMLRYLGFTLQTEKIEQGARISIEGHQSPPFADRTLTVPFDPSSAAFIAVAALIVPGSKITIPNICMNALRTGLFTTLQEMGGRIEYSDKREVAGEDVADLTVYHSPLRAVEVAAKRAPSMIDEYPVLAVAAAFAEGTTAMHGLKELRVKESDRLAAIAAGLSANGVQARIEGESLYVTGSGSVKGGGAVQTHMDHRIAMAFLVMGMASEHPVTVDDVSAIVTSFPGFTDLCNNLGGDIEHG